MAEKTSELRSLLARLAVVQGDLLRSPMGAALGPGAHLLALQLELFARIIHEVEVMKHGK